MAGRRSQRGPLTRREILAAALEIAERDGLEALSLHRIADAVGVRTMSLYNHVADKAAVLDGMADMVLAGVEIPDVSSTGWADGSRALARAFRSAAMRYPRTAPLVLTRRLNAPAAMPIVDAALGVAQRAGMDTTTAVRTVRAFIAFLIGSLLREVGTAGAGTPSSAVDRAAALTALGLPHVALASAELAVIDHTAELEYGLDLLISSIDRQHRE
jgi:TetR/AcrR family transcriptional regulator, tetracycline repressor protein